MEIYLIPRIQKCVVFIRFLASSSFGKQVWERFPTTYPEFMSKASKEKFHAQQISQNRFIYHLIVERRLWNKYAYSLLHAALDPMFQSAKTHKIEQLNVAKLSTGLDKLNWLKVKRIIKNVSTFQTKNTVYTQREQQNVNPSGSQKEKGTNNDMQQAEGDNQSLSTLVSCAKNGKCPIAQSYKASQEILGVSGTSLLPSKS